MLLGTSADIEKAIDQATLFISEYYGYKTASMTDCRIQLWIQKTSKARKSAPPLKTLPPTDEAYNGSRSSGYRPNLVWMAERYC